MDGLIDYLNCFEVWPVMMIVKRKKFNIIIQIKKELMRVELQVLNCDSRLVIITKKNYSL